MAKALRNKIKCQPYPDQLKCHALFLDSLLILLLFSEGTRHLPGLAYALMILDMIIYAPEKYTWHNVFVSGKEYTWDSFKSTGYGGKFPLATTATGRGNFSRFQELMEDNNNHNLTKTIEEFSKTNTQAIMIRGSSLFIHWLNHLDENSMNFLSSARNYGELKNSISLLLKQYIALGFNTATNPEIPLTHLKLLPHIQKAPLPIFVTNTKVVLGHKRVYKNGTDENSRKFISRIEHGGFLLKPNLVAIPCKLVPLHVKNPIELFSSRDNDGEYTELGSIESPSGATQECPWCKKHTKDNESVKFEKYSKYFTTIHEENNDNRHFSILRAKKLKPSPFSGKTYSSTSELFEAVGIYRDKYLPIYFGPNGNIVRENWGNGRINIMEDNNYDDDIDIDEAIRMVQKVSPGISLIYDNNSHSYRVLTDTVPFQKANDNYVDFAIIWDLDHDTRIIEVIEKIYFGGGLENYIIFSETKGRFTAIVSEKIRDPDMIPAPYFFKYSEYSSYTIKLDIETVLLDDGEEIVSDDMWSARIEAFNPKKHSDIHTRFNLGSKQIMVHENQYSPIPYRLTPTLQAR